MNDIEILAPCGSFDCVVAAVNAGADAIYLGGANFGARAYAKNFSDNELIDTIGYAHSYGVKVYLTVNTLMKNEEIDSLFSYILPLYEAGLDAVIIQDIGVFDYLHKNFPRLQLHVSTQLSTTTAYGASFWKERGATRIVSARELSLDEIKDIHSKVDIEIESFVHGALCYCYSGQCLFSSFIGGRSGNRGRCAQACRLMYLHEGRKDYLLSLKDMCTLEILPKILDAGVCSLKIEGRMKNAGYVAAVTSVYRKYVDMYLNDRANYRVDEEDLVKLMDMFNRGGFCEGYYNEAYPKDMLTHKKPSHEGVVVGKCINRLKNEISIQLLRDINPLDVIEIADKFDYTFKEGQKKGDVIKLRVTNECTMKKDGLIYRTRNNSLYNELEKRYLSGDSKHMVCFDFTAKKGECITLTAHCDGSSTEVTGAVCEGALNAPITEDEVKKQLCKLGNTSYECDECKVNISDDIFLSVGMLKGIRREALEKLDHALKNRDRRDSVEESYVLSHKSHKQKETTGYSVLLERFEDVKTVLEYPEIDRIYIDATCLDSDLSILKDCGREVFLAMPVILRKAFIQEIEKHDLSVFDGFLVRSIDSFEYIRNKGLSEGRCIIADSNIPCFNDYSAAVFDELKVKTTASLELTVDELLKKAPDDEMVIYGHVPMMVTAQNIGRAASGSITDRKNENYSYVNDFKYNNTTIYSARPLYLKDCIANRGRIIIAKNDKLSAKEILQGVLINNRIERPCTYGHYLKGVM